MSRLPFEAPQRHNLASAWLAHQVETEQLYICSKLFLHHHTIRHLELPSTCCATTWLPQYATHLLQERYDMLSKCSDVPVEFLLCLNYLLDHLASHKRFGGLLAWQWCGGLWDNRRLDTHWDSLDMSFLNCKWNSGREAGGVSTHGVQGQTLYVHSSSIKNTC